MLFREIDAVYCDFHTNRMNTTHSGKNAEFLNIKVGGCHSAFKYDTYTAVNPV
jgi:hypothetical protein